MTVNQAHDLALITQKGTTASVEMTRIGLCIVIS